MKKLLLALALLFAPSLAQAQCNGVFPSNTVCGTIAGGVPRAVAPSGFSAGLTIGTTSITGGTNTRVLFDNAGVVGEYTNAQLTALVQLATASLSGALPAWPNNTTTFFRGDGTYTGITCGALPALTTDVITSAGSCTTTLATVNGNVGTFGGAATHAQFTVNGKGLITAASSVTPAISFTNLTDQATLAQLPTIGANTILANNTGGAAVPAAIGPSSVLDIIGSTQGQILYRDAGAWQVLNPGGSGQLLSSGGAAANPSWITASGTGTVTSVGSDGSINTSIASNNPITGAGTLSIYGDPGSITNCALTGTVSGNALTVSLVSRSGSAPSAAVPCMIGFRNATIALGDYTFVKVTAATTFVTAASGDTFGSINSTPFRLWITAWNNSGTVVLGVSKQSTATQIFPLDENGGLGSTACNACGTATSAGVYYTTATQTNKPIRILGYMDWGSGLATAGVWASAPTRIQLMGPGTKKPGDVVQSVYLVDTTVFTTSSTSFTDVTGLSAAISPTSAANGVRVHAMVNASTNIGNNAGVGLLVRGSTPLATGVAVGSRPAATFYVGGTTPSATTTATVITLDNPGTTAATTYKIQVATIDGTNTVAVNATVTDSNSINFARLASEIVLDEIMQ